MSENTRVIVLISAQRKSNPSKSHANGCVWVILTKDAEPEEMIRASYIKSLRVKSMCAPDIAQQIATWSTWTLNDSVIRSSSYQNENLEITLMLAKGATRSWDRVNSLNISAKTVNTYRYRMFEKLRRQHGC